MTFTLLYEKGFTHMQKSTDKKLIHRVLSALACGGLVLPATSVSAAPVVVTAPVTEDMVTTEEGVAANITGTVGNIVVGTADAAVETNPVIGDPSSPSYYKYYRVTGSWLGSDDVTTLLLTGGTATIYSGTMGDVTGASIYLKNGGMATVTGASVVFNGGNTRQSMYGGLFGALASVNAEAAAPYARAMSRGGYATATTENGVAIARANKNVVAIKTGTPREVVGGTSSAMTNGSAGTDEKALNIAEANENSVVMDAGRTTSLWGSYAYASPANGIGSAQTSASGNKVTVNGGTVTNAAYYGMNGGVAMAEVSPATATASGNADRNTVTINDGTIAARITGGFANLSDWGDSKSLTATGNANIITVNGGTVKGLRGAFAKTQASLAGAASSAASGNTVTAAGGSYGGHIYGGVASADSSSGDATATASNNTIRLSGGTFTTDANVAGGIVCASGGSSAATAASNNVIDISGAPDLMRAALYGASLGNADGTLVGGTPDTMTGNTLNIRTQNITAKSIANFQNLNFYAPKGLSASDTLLTLTSASTTALDGARVNVCLPGGAPESVRLIRTANSAMTDTGTVYTAQSGVSLAYNVGLSADRNELLATRSASGGLLPQTKSLAETLAGTTAFLNAGTDLLAGDGIASTAAETAGAHGFTSFGALGINKLRHETGSHIDMRGTNLNVGFAREIKRGNGRILFGPVVEYGRGSYDSYLDSGTHGEGDTHYWGAGIILRQENADGNYCEASLRGGKLHADYTGNLIPATSYEIETPYIAAHLGVGRSAATKIGTLDTYLKYFYTRQSGTSATLSTSDPYDFHAVTSHRLRAADDRTGQRHAPCRDRDAI